VTSLDQLISIDRASSVPLYSQLARSIEELIASGGIAPGERLENEVRLADRLGVSRPTMRQAIQHLVDKGLLVRKRGVGTQVVHSRTRRQDELSSLYDDLADSRRDPRTRVLSFGRVPAPEVVAAALRVEPGSEVTAVERIRLAGEQPLALLRNYLAPGLRGITGEGLAATGLYRLLRENGVRLRVAEQTVGARSATAGEARLLDDRRGAPLLTMTRVAYDQAGRPIEYGDHLYRAGLYSFELTLIAR